MDNIKVVGSFAILRAINDFYGKNNGDIGPVVDALIDGSKNGSTVFIPVDSMNYNMLKAFKPEDNFESIDFDINLIESDVIDDPLIPIFTSSAELNKNKINHVKPLEITILNIMKLACKSDEIEGIVVNPWGKSFFIPRDFIEYIYDESRPLKEDEKLLNMGVEAYQNRDFKNAVKYYQMAADMGNVAAISNLGYCHYYGRSIPVNKEKARNCWEKAALFNDICAIYKLGDMYRNGDLEEDLRFSKEMYNRAYLECLDHGKPLYCYPDACLRILKYCKEDMTQFLYKITAEETVNLLKRRIDEGDIFSESLYEEAKEILNSLKEKNEE